MSQITPENGPIRILELRSTYGYGGGPDKTILLSAQRHDPAKYRVVVAYLRGLGDTRWNIDARAREMGLDYVEIRDPDRPGLVALRQILKLIRRRDIDIVHAHDAKTDFLGFWIAGLSRRVRVMSTAHGWGGKTRRTTFYNWLDKKVLRRFDRVVAVSEATRDILVQEGIRESRIRMIHNGIDEVAWSAERVDSTLRQELGLDDGQPLIGTVTRLDRIKDLFTFLEVARRVSERRPDARFAIAGEGPDADEIRARAVELGVDGVVSFLGYRSDLPNIYRGLSIHLMTSLSEGLPNSLLEAMSLGVPTVSTDVGGIHEAVRHGKNGYLYPRGDAEGLTAGVLRLIDDPAEYDRIRANGRQTIEQEFSFDLRLRRIEEVYEELAGR